MTAQRRSTPTPRLVLASASPARLATLRAAGIKPDVLVSGVDESSVVTDDAIELSGRLAQLKAEAAWAALPPTDDAVVLGCDSVLAFGGQVLGKPSTAEVAVTRWKTMRGGHGTLHTGHCLIATATGQRAAAVASTIVHFADVTDREIAAYVATGEPLRVAGAFTLDGLGAPFVERIDGDPGTVVGLSMPLLRQLLRTLGLEITDFWT